jgi:hypothetical protein
MRNGNRKDMNMTFWLSSLKLSTANPSATNWFEALKKRSQAARCVQLLLEALLPNELLPLSPCEVNTGLASLAMKVLDRRGRAGKEGTSLISTLEDHLNPKPGVGIGSNGRPAVRNVAIFSMVALMNVVGNPNGAGKQISKGRLVAPNSASELVMEDEEVEPLAGGSSSTGGVGVMMYSPSDAVTKPVVHADVFGGAVAELNATGRRYLSATGVGFGPELLPFFTALSGLSATSTLNTVADDESSFQRTKVLTKKQIEESQKTRRALMVANTVVGIANMFTIVSGLTSC